MGIDIAKMKGALAAMGMTAEDVGGSVDHLAKGGSPIGQVALALLNSASRTPAVHPNLQKFLAPSKFQEPMYHATQLNSFVTEPLGFSQFRTKASELGSHVGTQKQAQSILDTQKGLSPYVMPVHVQAKNPLRLKDYGDWSDRTMQELRDKGILSEELFAKRNDMSPKEMLGEMQNAIKNAGHDSVVYLNRREGMDVSPWQKLKSSELTGFSDEDFLKHFPEAKDSVILFDPQQIKSKIGNQGTYDINSPDITKAVGGSIHMADGGGLRNMPAHEGLAPYGTRYAGEGVKGQGYFGMQPAADGYSSEISAEDNPSLRNQEYPLMVPGISREELEMLLLGSQPTPSIFDKARAHAQKRIAAGMSPFAQPSELRYPVPK